MPRVDLAFPHHLTIFPPQIRPLLTVFPPQIRPRFTIFATDPTNPVLNLPDDRRLPDVRNLSRHRTSAKHRTTGTPTTERFYRISGLHRTSDPSRPTGRPVTSGRPTFPDTAELVQLPPFRYHPPSPTTTYLPQPPSFSRSEFGKCVYLCIGYLSCGFTVSLDV